MNKQLNILVLPGGGLHLSQQRVHEACNRSLFEKKDLIIFSGGNKAKENRGSTEAYIMNSYYENELKQKGAKRIVIREETSRDTYENISCSLRVIERYLQSIHPMDFDLRTVYEKIVITIASDKKHLARFEVSAKFIIAKQWLHELPIELRFVELNIDRKKEHLLESALWLMHQFDLYGEGFLPWLNRKLRAKSASVKKKSYYVQMPLTIQNRLAILAQLYDGNSSRSSVIELAYNSLRDYDYAYSPDQDELILNLKWSLYGQVQVVNPLKCFKDNITAGRQKIEMGGYNEDELRNTAGLLYHSERMTKMNISAPDFDQAIIKIYEECTEPYVLGDISMLPYIIFLSESAHYRSYRVYQFSPNHGKFVEITANQWVQKIVSIEKKQLA